jgi:Mg2+ and Co2+ transporter CorA
MTLALEATPARAMAVGEGLFRQVTGWVPGTGPQPLSEAEAANRELVRWFDIGRATTVEEVLTVLAPMCEGLKAEMIEDLLTPDDEPHGTRYGDGRIRLASSFSAEARRTEMDALRGEAEGAGALVIKPVELLANENWLISCWHPARIFSGANRLEDEPSDGPPPDLFERVAHRWACGTGRSSGDLGVLILHELVLSYAPAHRALSSWLEDWELGLYVDDRPDRESLPKLWGEMAVLRDWLNPLNRSGLRTDIDRAWLSATDHESVIEVDKRIDRALANLAELGATLRSSFQVLHVQQAQEEREQSERTQHRIEIMAAAFLIPTLVVGFYGANTWIPGQGKRWGFEVMVAALLVLSLGGAALMNYWHRQQKAKASKLANERAQLRAELMRGTQRGASDV